MGAKTLPFVAACCATVLTMSAWADETPAVPSWGITQLMLSLGQVKAASSRFVERKTLHMLSEPLIASGTLLYVAPDQVQKLTLSPQRERLAIKGDTLTLEGGQEDRNRTVSLKEYPEIQGIVEGIRATLAGDLPALNRFYAVRLEGDVAAWQLVLEPKDPKLKKFINSIRIIGSQNVIRTVDTAEADGDYSEMSVVETVQ
jgi:Outer membrane lipoprotein carrier protein LolA-like